MSTEAKFADNAGCGILLELSISFVHQLLVPTHEFSIYDCPLGNLHAGQGSIRKAERKRTSSAFGNEINFARG